MSYGQMICRTMERDARRFNELLVGVQNWPLTILPSPDGQFYIATPHKMILEIGPHCLLGWPSLHEGGNTGAKTSRDIATIRQYLEQSTDYTTPIDVANNWQAMPFSTEHTKRFVVAPTPGAMDVTIYATNLFRWLVVSSTAQLHADKRRLRKQVDVGIRDDRVG